MRVFKDLEMVEHLGSGLPRITEFYGPESFHFTENFLRITFTASRAVHEEEANDQGEASVNDPVNDPVLRLVQTLGNGPLAPSEIQQRLALKHRPTFRVNYLRPALERLWIEPTLPDKPNSRLQQYRLTAQGKALLS